MAWLLQPRRGYSMANFMAKAALPLGRDPKALDVAIVGQAAPHDHYTLRCVADTRQRPHSHSLVRGRQVPDVPSACGLCSLVRRRQMPDCMPCLCLPSSGRVAPTPCKPPAPPTTCSTCSASPAPAPFPSAPPSLCPVSSLRMPLCHRQTRAPRQLQLQLQAPPRPRAPSLEPHPPPPPRSDTRASRLTVRR